jgi:hypothetical protein
MARRQLARRWWAALTIILVAGACSSDSSSETNSASPSSSPAPTTTVARPPGPAADVSEELTPASDAFVASPQGGDLSGTSYELHEYVASGTATAYTASGELGGDGQWTFVSGQQAPYRTRIVVRRPSDPSRFNGTVLVEWLNVSGGVESDPEWGMTHEELLRTGTAWVGVSAQLIGITGGPVLVTAPGASGIAGKGLTQLNPARYGSLTHPGDGYAFDIYTQVARALHAGGPVLGGETAQRVFAGGQSQSAYALVTYVNGVQPLTKAFDGFFVYSRGAVGLKLVGPGESADLASSFGGTPSIFRTDTDVPIMDLQSETDVGGLLNSRAARQDDNDHFRLWEVTGTSHADVHLLGGVAAQLDCGVPVNDGPLHVAAKAAFRALDTWARTGQAPPSAPRLDLTADGSTVERDADGIATGGIRTPPIDVPVDVLSGIGGTSSLFCGIVGSTTPLPAERIAAMYPSSDEYQQRYDASVDATIRAGYALDDDRVALEAYAHPDRIAAG